MTVFTISPRLFFFIGLGFVACLKAALYVTKAACGIRINWTQEPVKWIFALYALAAAAYECFPVEYAVTGVEPQFDPAEVNLIPFSDLFQAISVFGVKQLPFGFKIKTAAARLLTSAILAIPLGVLLPQLHSRLRSFAITLSSSAVFCLAVEIAQYVEISYSLLEGPVVSLDDVIEGLIGSAAGFFLWRILYRRYGEKKHNNQL